jgi:hypothetical protein
VADGAAALAADRGRGERRPQGHIARGVFPFASGAGGDCLDRSALMPVSTGTIGIQQPSNAMEEYQPPRVISLGPAFGASVVFGAAQTVAVGSALPAGTYLVSATGGGTLDATTADVTVYPVTITGGPTPPS